MARYKIGRKIRRYREIANIVIKYGFGYLLEKAHLKLSILPIRKKNQILSPAVRLRKMLEELGPTFIKMGQILSTRPDLVPIEYLKELEKLQDSTEPVEYEKIKDVLEKNLKCKIEDTFDYFDEKPIASASISQVHIASYKKEKVAVKIQKPEIGEKIFLDMGILYDIAQLIERFVKEASIYRPVKIVEEFEKSVRKELDFSYEGRNIQRFRKNFSSYENIIIPDVYKELTGTKVLTLQFIEGVKITEIDKINSIDRKKLAQQGTEIILKQIFQDGFFHADPHPGNILVTKEGKFCLLDFGIVGRLTEEEKLQIISLLSGAIKANSEKIIKTLEAMGSYQAEEIDKRKLEREIDDYIEKYRDISLREINIDVLFDEIFSIMRKYRISVPANFSLLAKAILTLEGVATIIYPEYNISEYLQTYVLDFIEKKEKVKGILKDTLRNISSTYDILKELPETVEASLKMLKKGYINVAFEHKGLQNLTSTIDKSSSRVAFSLIISAILVSSSLIMVSGKGPKLWGHSAFGVVGFIVSGIFGIYLIISIIRNIRIMK